MSDGIHRIISQRMRQARTHRGLAQWEVAERMGISEAFYARIEQDRASLTLARFVRLVSVLGISPDSLLSGDKPIIYRDDRLLRWPHDDASMEVRRIYRRLRFAPEQWVGLIAHILDVVEPLDDTEKPGASAAHSAPSGSS